MVKLETILCPPLPQFLFEAAITMVRERLRTADTLLRGVFAGTIKAGAGVMTPGLFDGVGRFALRVFPANRDHRPIYFFWVAFVETRS